jgi:digeranylgeranylglycerophospholipid reductase
MITVAIVGAGPAGSYCAYKLAEKGIYPSIFDHSHPREKPCGGLISSVAQEFLPILKRLPIEHSERNVMHLILPSGRRISLHIREGKLLAFSRLKFDQHLLNMAVNEGTDLIEEKVVGLERRYGWWKVKTQRQSYEVKTIVGADGVNSLVRRSIIGSLSKRDKGLCFGYFVKGLEKENVTIKFLPTKKGYLWVIPRGEDTSLGIGSTEMPSLHELKKELEAFANKFCPQAEKTSAWTALIPNIKDAKTLRRPVAGSNWIIIGDAAGHVNPINGSGIIYALLDGELAAEAISENRPEVFNNLWIKTYGRNLLMSTMLRSWVYRRPLLEFYCIYLKIQTMIP